MRGACRQVTIPVVPGQAGGGSFHSIKKHKPIRTRWPIEKNNHPTEFLPFPRLLRAGFFFSGKRSKVIDMFFGIRMQRNQCVAHSGARTAEKRHSSLFGCDTTATRGKGKAADQKNMKTAESETRTMTSPRKKNNNSNNKKNKCRRCADECLLC